MLLWFGTGRAVSYLLFLDESGHDHRSMPYEVRGGVALKVDVLWGFVQAVQRLEQQAFGDLLFHYGSEIKGWKLLDKDRFKWAKQGEDLDGVARRKHALAFLNRGRNKDRPKREEFTAFGQACLMMARGIFELLRSHGAMLFATAFPRQVRRPKQYKHEEYLRKDHVFLLERYFYFLERENTAGLLVMDQTEKTQDRRFVQQMERYFTKTHTGRYRTSRIVPSPFFVDSDMSYPVQAADVCIYCINHGFRIPSRGMDAPPRPEVAQEFGPWLNELQYRGEGYRDGESFHTFGIVYIPDPYLARG